MFLAACSGGGTAANQGVDINGAAIRGKSDVDRYQSEAASRPDRPAVTPPATGSMPDGDDPVVVARAYFAAVAQGRYADAMTLREGAPPPDAIGGVDAPYRHYVATLGRPGPIDAGAGQLHVTIPVTLRVDDNNKRQTLAGDVVLHRVNDGIESDDPKAHRWRITSINVTPV